MSSATVRGAVAGACVVLLSGCSTLGGIRRPAPAPSASAPAPSVVRTYEQPEQRFAQMPLPGGFQLAGADFADDRHGAALYTDCDDDVCSAVLVTTDDGGRTWKNRPHPQPEAHQQDFAMGRDGTIVLTSGFDAWYTSHDNGATFRRSRNRDRPPAEMHTMNGPYEIDGADLVHWVDGRARLMAPPLPGQLSAVVFRPGRDLWVASADGGRMRTTVSRDEGRTWAEQAVPAPAASPAESMTVADLRVSADGGDLWLLGYPSWEQGFTAAWQLGAGGWNPVAADGPARGRLTAAALGRGVLAVSGDSVTGLLAAGHGFQPIDWPVGALEVLRDGTLQVTPDRARMYLGTGSGLDRHWVELHLPEN